MKIVKRSIKDKLLKKKNKKIILQFILIFGKTNTVM